MKDEFDLKTTAEIAAEAMVKALGKKSEKDRQKLKRPYLGEFFEVGPNGNIAPEAQTALQEAFKNIIPRL